MPTPWTRWNIGVVSTRVCQRDLADQSRPVTPCLNIADVTSQVMVEGMFSSTKYFGAGPWSTEPWQKYGVWKKIQGEEMMIHLDDFRVHNSRKATQKSKAYELRPVPDPPDSPDISPCDFWFFGWSKGAMRGAEFRAASEVQTFRLEFWQNFGGCTLISV
jgi:hypothetical protein